MPTATAKEWDAVIRKMNQDLRSNPGNRVIPTDVPEAFTRAEMAAAAAKPMTIEEFLGDFEEEDIPMPVKVKETTEEVMPEDSSTRKGIPMHRGLFQYFPSALAAVAQVSRVCNDKHNPGQPLHWSKENSNDHNDALLRHIADTSNDPLARDPEDGTLLAAKVAWRALAHLQVLHDHGAEIFAEEE